jgi:outer membrane lipoprotein-sorting protein
MDSRRGLQLWGPVGRWLFLNWPRGSWQYDLICGAIIVGLFVLPNAEPQTLDVDGVLAAIERVDAGLQSFTADMVATEHLILFDDESTESGTMAFLKPAYFRREILEPNDRTELITDNQAMVYIPRIKQAQIFTLEGGGGEGPNFEVPGLASSARLKEAYDVSLVETTTGAGDGVRLYVLRLIPRAGTEPARRYKSILLTVAEGEWHPARRIVLEEHAGDTDTIVLSNVVRNPRLRPDDFEIELPEGTEIIRHGNGSSGVVSSRELHLELTPRAGFR